MSWCMVNMSWGIEMSAKIKHYLWPRLKLPLTMVNYHRLAIESSINLMDN